MDYKLYCIGVDGHVVKRYDFAGADDLAALDRVRELCEEFEIEVWERARFVARLAKDGTASREPHP